MGDLISRNDVLNIVRNFFEYKMYEIYGDREEIPIGELQPILNDSKLLSGKIKAIPAVEPVRWEWIDVKDALPPKEERWKEYIVCVERSHYPTSTYDIIDSPYSETIITTAKYDSQQKIWHLQWDEQLNALINTDDSPLNGDHITHWMPLPKL